MIFVIIGLLAGIWLGEFFLNDGPWLGALLGVLAGLFIDQQRKVRALRVAVQDLQRSFRSMPPQSMPKVNAPSSLPVNTTPVAPPVMDFNLDFATSSAGSSPISSHTHVKATPRVKSTTQDMWQTPPGNDPVSDLLKRAMEFFTGGNPVVRIGMVVLFFGISFLMKYAAGQGYFPLEVRFVAVIIAASGLWVFGWKTRLRQGGYGLVVQGGAVAIFYLTVYAAAKLYGFLPLEMALLLLCVIAAAGVFLALLQNAQVLAIFATAGGFMAPILTASGSGSYLFLFTFYLLLNSAILSIALSRSWRLLNWTGFMFTFVIGALWGVFDYRADYYVSAQVFLIAFFAMYLTVAVLFSLQQSPSSHGIVDGSLVFALPLAAFTLQAGLVHNTEYALAVSALLLAVVYAALCAGLKKYRGDEQVILWQAFLTLAVGFVTLAIPLALNANWTSVSWALEAAGLVWVGLRQQHLRPRLAGYGLFGGAVISLCGVHGLHTGNVPIISGDFLNLTLLAFSSLSIAYVLHSFEKVTFAYEALLRSAFTALGVFTWGAAGFNELNAYISESDLFGMQLLFCGMSALLVLVCSQRLQWPGLQNCVWLLLPGSILLTVVADSDASAHQSILQGYGMWACILILVVNYRFLFLQEQQPDGDKQTTLMGVWHTLAAWWIFFLITLETSWQINSQQLTANSVIILWGAVLALPLLLLSWLSTRAHWPFLNMAYVYRNWVPLPFFGYLIFWFITSLTHSIADNQDYTPVLNLLDFSALLVVLVLGNAVHQGLLAQLSPLTRGQRFGMIGLLSFVWLNVVVLRALSHGENISYSRDALWASASVQMSLSILWALCALLLMHFARKLSSRTMWFCAAALLVVVVLKLFLKDLTDSDTLTRIMSFLVVGGIMLCIGYIAPLPVKADSTASQ